MSQATRKINQTEINQAGMNQSASQQPTIESLELIAREEPLPPLGEPTDRDRPISFATVFLNLKNPQNAVAQMQLQQLNIINTKTLDVLMTLEQPQIIRLKPLENATVEVQLISQSRYPELGIIKAIATYQILTDPNQPAARSATDHIQYHIESPSIPVQR